MLYLDAAATTPVRHEVLQALWPYLTGSFGNPSSTSDLGSDAARALADAHAGIAELVGGRASEVTVTSGGTEADNLAVKGLALGRPRGRHLVTSRLEHPAVLESVAYLERFHGFTTSYAEPAADGLVTAEAVTAVLRDDTALVTIALADNEIGTVQPIAAIAAAAHVSGALMHTDAVQAAGWLDVDVRALGVDALSLSGHKLGAPKGVGALVVRAGVAVEPLVHGGGQERGRRSGTENVAFAVGLGVAARLAAAERGAKTARASEARDAFLAAVLGRVGGARLTGADPLAGGIRLPGHASFVIDGVAGEPLLLDLERAGVIGSSGSACAAGRDEPSPVLLALGFTPAEARGAVRFTWTDAAPSDLARVADTLADAAAALRAGG